MSAMSPRSNIPLIPWEQAKEKLRTAWTPGAHATILGPTGSGKTVLAREMAEMRRYVMWLAIKTRDPELSALTRRGWRLTRDLVPDPQGTSSRWLVWPRAAGIRPTRVRQADVFRRRFDQVHEAGGWTIVADELTYLTDDLRLIDDCRTVLRTLRSDNVSMLMCAQRPRRIPIEALTESSLVCIFRQPDAYDRQRLSDLGADMPARELGAAIAALPRFHFITVDRAAGVLWSSCVDR